DDLLVFFLDGDESHLGPGDGFADGGGVRCVVLATLAAHAVRADEFRGHQLKELVARDFGFDQCRFAVLVYAVNGKNVLGEINPYGDNVHDFPLLVVLMKTAISIMALLMPFAATSPQPRDGEVPFIR